MKRFPGNLLAAVVLVVPTFGQPREFSDDFSTSAVYNSDTLYAGCPYPIGPGGPLAKYSTIEPVDIDVFSHKAAAGGGFLNVSDRQQRNGLGTSRMNLVVVGAVDNPGFNCGMPGAPDQTFNNDTDICIYGGFVFHAFDLKLSGGGFGVDGQPGVAGVDDDCDGTTDEVGSVSPDEADESPSHRAITVGDRYGPPYPDGGLADCPNAPSDGLPGVGGVDDDGDGTIDNYDELGTGNDSDDDGGRSYRGIFMKLDFDATSAILLNIDPGSGSGGNAFSIREFVGGVESQVRRGNVIGAYYQPKTPYNYAFCASGTCFGTMLWAGTDLANPADIVGPAANSAHTGAKDALVGFSTGASEPMFQRNRQFRGNSSFSDAYWVCEGNRYPSPSTDLDKDKDVDGFDFLTFANCYNGSDRKPLAACENSLADLDKDGDTDGFDFLTFANCYNGSDRKPLAPCFPPNLTACGF